MKFETEFIQLEQEERIYFEMYKEDANHRLGIYIGETFGYTNSENANQYKLEIEAFPMDKWVEFKQKLFDHLVVDGYEISTDYLQELVKELESFGKPAEEAKEQLP